MAAALAIALALWAADRARAPGHLRVPVGVRLARPGETHTVVAQLEGPAGELLVCRLRRPTLRPDAGPPFDAGDVVLPPGVRGVRVRSLETETAVELGERAR